MMVEGPRVRIPLSHGLKDFGDHPALPPRQARTSKGLSIWEPLTHYSTTFVGAGNVLLQSSIHIVHAEIQYPYARHM